MRKHEPFFMDRQKAETNHSRRKKMLLLKEQSIYQKL